MKRTPCLVAALTFALAGAPAPGPAHATSLQKCQSSDGSIGYTDGSCRIFGNDAVELSSHEIEMPADNALALGYPELDRRDAVATVGMGSAGGRRSPADGCARTPTQLAMDLRAALALGDVNRVAESYHWAGMANDEGQRTLDRLQALVGRPVLDSRYFDATYGMGDAMVYASAGPAAPVEAGGGQLQLLLGDGDGPGAATIDFDVHHYAGCYFVSF